MTAPSSLNAATLPMLANMNMKDSRWLTLEVCREYQRNRCTRTEEECKFAHPPAHVDQQNGRVMCCFDSIKGKCQRNEPPCKYLHPPQHLKEQLLQNGRQNLALKYHWSQLMAQNQTNYGQYPSPMLPSVGIPPMPGLPMAMDGGARFPLMPSALQSQQFITGNPSYMYQLGMGGGVPGAGLPLQFSQSNSVFDHQVLGAQLPVSSAVGAAPQKAPRADRLEVQGMTIPMKRPAMDGKGGIPMYQPSYPMAGYPQPTQQPYIPVSFYGYQDMAQPTPYLVAGHTPGLQRL